MSQRTPSDCSAMEVSVSMAALRKRVAPVAADGRYELFKISVAFEGPESRRQHGIPPADELPR